MRILLTDEEFEMYHKLRRTNKKGVWYNDIDFMELHPLGALKMGGLVRAEYDSVRKDDLLIPTLTADKYVYRESP